MDGIFTVAGAAIGMFVGTNIDDLIVLTVLFPSARANGKPAPRQIWTGQIPRDRRAGRGIGDRGSGPYACAVLESVLGTLFRATGPGSLKRIVPGDQLVNALSWFQARNALAGIAGPALGGLLLALHWAAPFATKALAHGISVGTLLAIRTPLPGTTRLSGGVPRQLFAGLEFLWRDRFLRSALLGAGAVNLVFVAVHSMVTLDSAEEGFHMEEIGLVVALAAVGGLVGAALAPRLSRMLTPRQVFLIVLGGGAVLVPVMALATNPIVLALLFAVNMILPPVVSVVVTAARVSRAPEELQGRATTATALVSMGIAPLGPILSGFIVDNTEGGTGFVAYGALLGVLALLAAIDRGLGTYVVPEPVVEDQAVPRQTVPA